KASRVEGEDEEIRLGVERLIRKWKIVLSTLLKNETEKPSCSVATAPADHGPAKPASGTGNGADPGEIEEAKAKTETETEAPATGGKAGGGDPEHAGAARAAASIPAVGITTGNDHDPEQAAERRKQWFAALEQDARDDGGDPGDIPACLRRSP